MNKAFQTTNSIRKSEIIALNNTYGLITFGKMGEQKQRNKPKENVNFDTHTHTIHHSVSRQSERNV